MQAIQSTGQETNFSMMWGVNAPKDNFRYKEGKKKRFNPSTLVMPGFIPPCESYFKEWIAHVILRRYGRHCNLSRLLRTLRNIG